MTYKSNTQTKLHKQKNYEMSYTKTEIHKQNSYEIRATPKQKLTLKIAMK